jgi:hypothetical protein
MLNWLRRLRQPKEPGLGPSLQATVDEDGRGGWAWRVYLDDGHQQLDLSSGTSSGYEEARAAMGAEYEAEKRRRRPTLLAAKVSVGGGMHLLGVRTEGRLELRLLAPDRWSREPMSLASWIGCTEAQIEDVFVCRTGNEASVHAGMTEFRIRANDAPSFAQLLGVPFEVDDNPGDVKSSG